MSTKCILFGEISESIYLTSDFSIRENVFVFFLERWFCIIYKWGKWEKMIMKIIRKKKDIQFQEGRKIIMYFCKKTCLICLQEIIRRKLSFHERPFLSEVRRFGVQWQWHLKESGRVSSVLEGDFKTKL